MPHQLQAVELQEARLWTVSVRPQQVRFSHTDILGALLLAGQRFAERPSGWRDVLVIFSDMRQDTADLNLETPRKIEVEAALSRTEKKGLNYADRSRNALGLLYPARH